MNRKHFNKRNLKKRRRRIVFRVLSRLILLFLILFALGFVLKKIGLFTIRNVDVHGNDKVKSERIIKKAQLIKGTNYYDLSKRKRMAGLKSIPYIKDGKIKYQPGGKISVEVSERRPLFQVFAGSYYLLDEDFRILESRREKLENILNIIGFDLEDKKPGQYILDHREEASKKELMEKILKTDYQLVENLRSIELADAVANFVTLNGITVEFGSYNNMDYKLKMLGLILEDIKENDRKAALIQLEKGPNPILVEETDTGDKSSSDPENSKNQEHEKNREKSEQKNMEEGQGE